MSVEFDIDKEKNIISIIVSDRVNRDRVNFILSKLHEITVGYSGYHLLFDLRDTYLEKRQLDMTRVVDIASSIGAMKDELGGKIAHVSPDDDARLAHSKDIESVVSVWGIDYKVFTDIEKAKEWLEI